MIKILELRVKNDDLLSIFAQLDDVEDLIAKEDKKDFDKEREDVKKELASTKSFNDDWQDMKKDFLKKKQNKSAEPKSLNNNYGGKYPAQYPGGSLTWEEAAQLVAPGSKIYEDTVNGRFQVMFNRTSRSRSWMT